MIYKNFAPKIKIPNINQIIIEEKLNSKKVFENKIKLIIWNTYKSKKRNFTRDLESLCKQSDLMLLQEYYPTAKFIENTKFLKVKDSAVAVSFYSKNVPTGVCTISNISHYDCDFIKSEVHEPILKTPKVTLITKYKCKSGKPIYVINTHVINFVRKHKFTIYMNQIDKALSEIKDLIIFGGDFNSWNKSRKKVIDKIVSKHNLTEVKFDVDKRTLKLDHVFVRGFKVEDAKVLHSIKSSDHKPLLVGLSLD